MNVSRFEIIDTSLKPSDRYLVNSEMGDKFFGRIEDDTLLLFNWPPIDTELNINIYPSPGASPLAVTSSGYVIGEETCFKNVIAPSPSYIFDTENNSISMLKPKYSYTEYCDVISNEISTTIDNAYRMHDKVHLLFSGGLDSLVLLSFIMRKQLLDRTILIVNENYAVNTKNRIHPNDIRKQALKKLIAWIRPQCFDVHEHGTSKDELINIINTEPLWKIKSYTAYLFFNRYHNSALMMGIKGNNTLLHRGIIAGQIMLHDPNKVWYDFSISNKFYTQDLLKYDYTKDRVPYYNRFFAKKSYPKLTGINNNVLISPLGTDKVFSILRQLDFSTVDLNVVADGLMPRQLIQNNVGTVLDEYIIKENTTEWDNMDSQLIEMSMLDEKVLEVPYDLNHHIMGIGWIEQELKLAKDTGLINFNTILSIKSLQMISDRFK